MYHISVELAFHSSLLQEDEARKCFHEWMKKKNTQAQQEKLLMDYKKQEEQSILYTRTQEDSDAAFARLVCQTSLSSIYYNFNTQLR